MKESRTVMRTRRAIVNSMLQLLQEKGFDEISVTDIAEKTMITRATFYKYYEDKNHLIKSVIQESKEQIFDGQLKKHTYKSFRELFLKIAEIGIDFILDNEENFYLFVNKKSNESLLNIVLNMMNDYIAEFLNNKFANSSYPVPVAIVSRFITGGLVYSAIYFIKNRGKYSKTEILKYIDFMIEQGPLALKK